MTSTQAAYLGYFGVVAGILAGLWGLYYLRQQNVREVRKEYAEDKAAAVRAAVEDGAREINRVRDDLIEMTNQRDYWRARAAQYEDRAAGRLKED